MTAALAVPDDVWNELVASLDLELETAGFLLAGLAEDPTDVTLLGRSFREVSPEHYRERAGHAMVISTRACVTAFAAAQVDSAVPVFVHTHPGTSAAPSQRDERVDAALREPALIRSQASLYASLIVGGSSERPSFTGRIYNRDGILAELSRLRVVGRHIHVFLAEDEHDADLDDAIYDRQIRAFGKDGQRILSRLRAGVVGAGGTGSAIFEQLVRHGVRDIVVTDDDRITESNITRIHESGTSDEGKPKIEVAEAAAARIGLDTDVTSIDGRITDPAVEHHLRHRDVIFGCTDDERGRNVLAKLAISHLIPVFDMGFVIDADENGSIKGLDGRVTTLLPGTACLLCRGRITPRGLSAESLHREERARRAAEGYAPALGERDPSVGAFTTLIACFAINELLDRLFGYSQGSPTSGSTEVLIRLADRRWSFNSRPASPTHWCGDSRNYGRGDVARL